MEPFGYMQSILKASQQRRSLPSTTFYSDLVYEIDENGMKSAAWIAHGDALFRAGHDAHNSPFVQE